MTDALNIIYLILSNGFTFLFTAYIFDGVSLGMISVVLMVLSLLLIGLLNVPKKGG